MNSQEFFEKLKQNPNPVVVDLWAPWCGPCKMVKPILEKLAVEYAGRVDLWQVNADDNQDLLNELKVYGIPTLIVYRNGKETQRQVGAKSASALHALFEKLASGDESVPTGLSNVTRITRLAAGFAIAAIGWVTQSHWLVLLLGGAIMFTAVYDRCPIWRALTTQFKKLSHPA